MPLSEAVEDEGQEGGGNASPRITDDCLDVRLGPSQLHRHRSARRRELHGVGQDVPEHLLEPIGIQVIELVPPAVRTALMPGHESAEHAMPLDAYVDEVMALLEADPEAHEVLVEQVKLLRYAEVRGRVAGEVRGDEARAHIDALSQRYLGHDYRAPIRSERVVLRIAPVRQRSSGL